MALAARAVVMPRMAPVAAEFIVVWRHPSITWRRPTREVRNFFAIVTSMAIIMVALVLITAGGLADSNALQIFLR